jgi:hypothetical protein
VAPGRGCGSWERVWLLGEGVAPGRGCGSWERVWLLGEGVAPGRERKWLLGEKMAPGEICAVSSVLVAASKQYRLTG